MKRRGSKSKNVRVHNKIEMVCEVFRRRRFERERKQFDEFVQDSLRGLSEESQDVQLLNESKQMTEYKKTLNWMITNGTTTR